MAGGSGTQQDPYIFNTFVELLELMLDAQETDYYEYGGTATEEDLNDIFPEGLENTITLTGSIDFKDLTISNLRSFSTKVITLYGSIKNVTFKNVIWNAGGSNLYFVYGNPIVVNTKMYLNLGLQLNDITTKRFSIIHADGNYGYVDKCVFCLSGNVTSGTVYTGTYSIVSISGVMEDCNIVFYNFTFPNSLYIKRYSTSTPTGIKMIGCSISGKINVSALYDTYPNSTTTNTNNLNIFNVECDGTFTHNSNGLTIFNSTKAPNFVEDTTSNFIGVTDEQMKNPSYLRSIGFPCYGGE